MKKIILSTLLLLLGLNTAFAQEKLVDIKKITTPKGRNLELNLSYYSITKRSAVT